MAKGLGSFSGGATLQKSKLSQSQKSKGWDAKTDDSGGGGIGGKGIFNGGGGGDDGGDDDDYFDEFGDDGEGGGDGGFFKMLIAENYGRAAIEAVLSEWYRTFDTLPLILRQAVQMGLFSSQSLVRFCAMDNRPAVTRAVARSLPASVSRGFVGRMMADPAFVQKLVIEGGITTVSSLMWEAQQRGERFSRELDVVAANTLSLLAANLALVWAVAPNRSFGNPAKLPFQQMLARLPNNAFELNVPQRSFSTGARAAGVFAKTAQLAGVGALAGGFMSVAGRASAALRRRADPSYSPSVAPPSFAAAAGGMALSMGVFGNARYQVVAGVDRYLFDHCNFLWSYLATSTVLRAVSHSYGQHTRLALMGLPTDEPERQRPSPVQQPAARAQRLRQRPSGQPAAAQQPAADPAKRRVRKKVAAQKGFAMSAGAGA